MVEPNRDRRAEQEARDRRQPGTALNVGRPRARETRRRTAAFLRVLAGGETIRYSLRASGMSPARFAGLMDDPRFRAAVWALVNEREG